MMQLLQLHRAESSYLGRESMSHEQRQLATTFGNCVHPWDSRRTRQGSGDYTHTHIDLEGT